MNKQNKIFIGILIVLLVLLALVGQAYATEPDYMALMVEAAITGDYEAGQAAEIARNEKVDRLGLEYVKVDWEELYLLSKIIYAEAGSSWLTDEHQQLVGSVLLNRVASSEFPNSMKACIYQAGQYYSENSRYFANLKPSERAVRNALYLLENGSIAPASVVFQSNYKNLGSGHYKVIYDKYLGTSYFAYSMHMELYEEPCMAELLEEVTQ